MLPDNLSGGPHGIGDPDDKTLRKVEKEILIPKKIREKTKVEKCVPEVEAFSKCCIDSTFWMVWKCKPETKALNKCLDKWYHDEDFIKQCTEEYLEERSFYRRTGIKQKQRKKENVLI